MSASARNPKALRPPPKKILGRRKRQVLLTDLPDDILVKVIHHALQMNPRLPGEVSRRVCSRFQSIGRIIAQLSHRFHSLLRHAITSLQLTSYPPHTWLNAMLIFAQRSLTSLQLTLADAPISRHPPVQSSRLCLMLALTHPPLRVLCLSSLAPAPFEYVVSMLRALPHLREIDLGAPRPVDVAAIAHSCPSLRSLSLGRAAHYREVEEMRRQFSRLVAGPTGRSLTSLKMPWCCVSRDAFITIGKNCERLERLAVEFGAIHWISYRAFIAKTPIRINTQDVAECAKEQRALVRTMLRAVGDGRLRTFSMRTLDGIPPPDLEMIFERLSGLAELDLSVGTHSSRRPCPKRSFDKLTHALAKSLRRVNIAGIRFTAQQVERFANEYSNLQTLSVWMSHHERPSVDVFSTFGERIRHLSLLCDWDANMCAAVGKYNTKLETLFLITTHLPLDSISDLLTGIRFTLNEFRLFFHRKNGLDGVDDVGNENEEHPEQQQPQPQPQQQQDQNQAGNHPSDQKETNGIIHDTARLVAKGCAANLEVLKISGVSSGHSFVDCTTIASELGRSAPHLYQICEKNITD